MKMIFHFIHSEVQSEAWANSVDNSQVVSAVSADTPAIENKYKHLSKDEKHISKYFNVILSTVHSHNCSKRYLQDWEAEAIDLLTNWHSLKVKKPTVILFQLQVERPYINHNGQLIYLQNQYTPQPIVHNSMVSDSQDGISRDGRLER